MSFKPVAALLCSIMAFCVASICQASFEPLQRRFVTPSDAIALLKQELLIQTLDINTIQDRSCVALDDQAKTALGDDNPVSGEPTSPEPGTAFVSWYAQCVSDYYRTMCNLHGAQVSGYLLQPPTLKQIDLNLGQKDFLSSNWTDFNSNVQMLIIADLVSRILGPDDVIESFGFVKSAQEIRDEILKSVDSAASAQPLKTEEALRRIILTLLLRNEFLMY